jgi:hypothetical protein
VPHPDPEVTMTTATMAATRRHPRGCQHCVSVDAYRAARVAAELAREETTRGWATELSEYPPIVTFRDWLIQTRNAA